MFLNRVDELDQLRSRFDGGEAELVITPVFTSSAPASGPRARLAASAS